MSKLEPIVEELKTLPAAQLAEATGSDIAGIIGHILILYKEHPEAERRKIELV